jgi:hypothetical protein
LSATAAFRETLTEVTPVLLPYETAIVQLLLGSVDEERLTGVIVVDEDVPESVTPVGTFN